MGVGPDQAGFWGTWGAAPGFEQQQMDMLRQNALKVDTRGREVDTKKKEFELGNEQLMQHLMQQAAGQPQEPSVGRSQAAPMERIADIALRSGLWKPAKELANTASNIRRREAASVASLSSAAVHELDARKKEAVLYDSLMQGVEDQAGFDTANTVFSGMTGMQSPHAGATFTPELKETIQTQAIDAKDRAQQAITATEYASRDRNRQSQIDHRKFLENFDEWLKRQRERQKLLKDKVGGDMKAPNNAEVSSTSALLKQQFYPGLNFASDLTQAEKDSLADGARAIASRAKELMRQNQGLSWDIAQQRAMSEMAEDWVKNPSALDKFNPFARDKTVFKHAGKTPGTAIPVAASKDKMVKDRWYKTSRGTLQWSGTGFRQPVAASAAGGDTAEDAGLDENEDDTDE